MESIHMTLLSLTLARSLVSDGPRPAHVHHQSVLHALTFTRVCSIYQSSKETSHALSRSLLHLILHFTFRGRRSSTPLSLSTRDGKSHNRNRNVTQSILPNLSHRHQMVVAGGAASTRSQPPSAAARTTMLLTSACCSYGEIGASVGSGVSTGRLVRDQKIRPSAHTKSNQYMHRCTYVIRRTRSSWRRGSR
jgi:hypothetical protein